MGLVATFLGLNFSAFLFGLVAGFLTDRWGSQRTLLAAASAFFLTLLALGLTKNFWVFVALSLVGGGFGFAGIWTAARKRVVELAPAAEVGAYFGLYNLTTKVSVVMSLIFSILADRFGFQVALLSLALPCGLGLLFLWFASERQSFFRILRN
jgi:MFS-type transporter involved in bile tolerance (Atg22 family)